MLTELFKAAEKLEITNITHINVSDRLNMKILFDKNLLVELGTCLLYTSVREILR